MTEQSPQPHLFDRIRSNFGIVFIPNPDDPSQPYLCEDLTEGHKHTEACYEPSEAAVDRLEYAVAESHFRTRGVLHTTHTLDDIPTPVPLVEDFLYQGTLARCIGASGDLKSFVMLSMTAHVGWGVPWAGKRVTQGRTLYVVGEGETGLPKRVRALERHCGRDLENVTFITMPIQIDTRSADWHRLKVMAKRHDLVIIDTQARCTTGVEENSAKEMGQVISALDELRTDSGACVVPVHHTGADGSKRARGSTAVKGAVQSEIHVERNRVTNIVTVKSGKQKDNAELSVNLTPKTVVIDGLFNAFGEPETSLVLVSRSVEDHVSDSTTDTSPQFYAAVLDAKYGRAEWSSWPRRTLVERLREDGHKLGSNKAQAVQRLGKEGAETASRPANS